MSFVLPGWAVSNQKSVQREVEPYRTMTPTERGNILSSLCRLAMDQLAANANREKVIAWRDPLPPDSVRILAALREQERRRQK